MQVVNLDFSKLDVPLTPDENLGLTKFLFDKGFGQGRLQKGLSVNNVGERYSVSDGVKSLSATKELFPPIHVVLPWAIDDDNMRESLICLPGTKRDVAGIIDYYDGYEPEEITINGKPYQGFTCDIDDLISVAKDPESDYKGDISTIYSISENDLQQHVAERDYRLELLGPIV